MEVNSLIPLFVIQDSLTYTKPEKLEVIAGDEGFRCLIQDAAVGIKLSFPNTETRVVIRYGSSLQEVFNVAEIKIGLVTVDGWMQSFQAESELIIQSVQEPIAVVQVVPEIFIVKY